MKLHDFPRQIIESFQVSQPILLHQQALAEMLQHVRDGMPDEVAGHLIGFPVNTSDGANGLYIERAVRGICEASRTHFILHPESFKRTNALCKETNTILVGYYHSHPGYGIFLSPTDLYNFSDHYAKPYNVAVVLDPTKEMMVGTPGIGFFGWGKDGRPNQLSVQNVILVEHRPEVVTNETVKGRSMDRYARQRLILWLKQEVITDANILVVGAGTLGNEIIKNLILLGVEKATIVDNDIVTEVNLSRSVLFRDIDLGESKAEVAAQRARELHPDPNLQILGINANIISDIGSLEYSKFSCVILTVDNQEARMWVNRYSYLNGTPLIDTGVAGQSGNVIVLFNTPSGPCLECGWPESEYDLLSARYRCLLEGLALTESPIPMVITSAAIIGGMAVQECVRVLHLLKAQDSDEASIINYDGLTLSYNGENNYFPKWRQTRNTKCRCDHKRITDLKVLPFTTQRDTLVSHITSRIREHLGVDHVELHYDREMVYAVKCRNCGHEQPIKPTWVGGFRRENCPKCKKFELVSKRAVKTLEDGYTLKEFGIPPNHLLPILYSTQDSALHKVYMVIEG